MNDPWTVEKVVLPWGIDRIEPIALNGAKCFALVKGARPIAIGVAWHLHPQDLVYVAWVRDAMLAGAKGLPVIACLRIGFGVGLFKWVDFQEEPDEVGMARQKNGAEKLCVTYRSERLAPAAGYPDQRRPRWA